MKYWVRCLTHANLTAARQLADVGTIVIEGLKLLGKDVSETEGDQQIIIGGALARREHQIPDSAIIYNWEQAGNFHFSPEYVTLMRRCRTVWDYNKTNQQRMMELYRIPTVYVPFGYVPALTFAPAHREQDIDVCFMGSMFAEHRKLIRNAMIHRGLNVVFSENCYDAYRQEVTERSKVVLNMHFHKEKVMESLRIGHALANKKAVLCQVDPDTAVDEELLPACHCVKYEKLVDAACMLVASPELRKDLEQRGHEIIKQRWMPSILEKVL